MSIPESAYEDDLPTKKGSPFDMLNFVLLMLKKSPDHDGIVRSIDDMIENSDGEVQQGWRDTKARYLRVREQGLVG